jgi:hypothetical protein
MLAHGFRHQLPVAGGRLPILGSDGELLVGRRDLAAADGG